MLKEKLKRWLFKDELEIINKVASMELEVSQAVEKLNIATDLACEANTISQTSHTLNTQIKELVTPLLDIGMDVGFHEAHSWAVVCIQGKPEYVKFIPLERKDTKEIINFLKHYQKSSHIIDSPLAFRRIIKDELFI